MDLLIAWLIIARLTENKLFHDSVFFVLQLVSLFKGMLNEPVSLFEVVGRAIGTKCAAVD
jgi:hypothetical protein